MVPAAAAFVIFMSGDTPFFFLFLFSQNSPLSNVFPALLYTVLLRVTTAICRRADKKREAALPLLHKFSKIQNRLDIRAHFFQLLQRLDIPEHHQVSMIDIPPHQAAAQSHGPEQP